MKITKTALALAGLLLMIGAISVVEAGIKTHGEVLGVGTDALLGGDLTDPEDDGLPDEDTNYNAKFTASDEPAFGGGESAFNVFDNLLGGGNDKWCCGPGGIAEGEVISVTAEFEEAYVLSHFTVSSANDAPGRDPIKWEIHGSNDGENFTPIYSRDGENLFTERLQVILFEAGKVDGFDVSINRKTLIITENKKTGKCKAFTSDDALKKMQIYMKEEKRKYNKLKEGNKI